MLLRKWKMLLKKCLVKGGNEMLIKKLINGEEITDEDLQDELDAICEREHSGCNNECPVYECILTDAVKEESSCPFRSDGKKMLEALRIKAKVIII